MNRWLFLSIVLTAVAVGASLYLYEYRERYLPPEVPTHWNAAGEVDASVPRDQLLFQFLLLPGVMAAFVLLTLALPWLSPKPFSVESFRGSYNYIMFLAVAMMGWIHASLLARWVWADLDFVRVMMGGMFLFFALMGNMLGKVRRNFYVGVRTPWTLASEAVWNRTHRLAAWLFTGAGVVGLVAVLCMVPPLLALPLIFVAAIVPVVYSLVLYKRLEKEGKLDAPAAAAPREGDLT